MDITELLNKGIIAKRNGDYELAIEIYKSAMTLSPEDSRSYSNLAKVYIGIKKYNAALRCLLILNHWNYLKQFHLNDPLNQIIINENIDKFNAPNFALDNNKIIYPQYISLALKINPKLNELIYRADNLTYNIGHSFIGSINNQFGVLDFVVNDEDSLFNNFNLKQLGLSAGVDYRETTLSKIFMVCGFMFAHINLNKQIKLDEQVPYYYTINDLKFDIENYIKYINPTY